MRTFRIFQLLAVALVLGACGDSGSGGGTQTAQQVSPDTSDQVVLSHECRLVMGWDPWEPYQYQISSEDVIGLDVDLLSAVLDNAGCEISFYRESWTELLYLMKTGEVDVLAGATQTVIRDEFAYFSDEYRDEEFYLYVTSDRLEEIADKGIEQLIGENFRIGVIEGYLYGDAVTELQNDARFEDQFVYSSMSETNVSLLLDGKVDGIIEDKYVGAAIIRRKNLADEITSHTLPLGRSGVRIMISRASVDEPRYERINQSLQQLVANGEIQRMLDHYLNQ